MYKLKDSEFLTAKEKAAVLRQWKRFIENGFHYGDFTKRLYEHLHLHCAFIAHFDRGGFYATYFQDPEDTIRFLNQFDSDYGFKSVEYGADWWIQGEYEDVNTAMCDILQLHRAKLYADLSDKVRRNDLEEAKRLLAKHGVTG